MPQRYSPITITGSATTCAVDKIWMTVLCSSAAAESTFVSKILRELNGLDAVQEILKCVSTKVLILTMYDSDHLIRESLEAEPADMS